ncbi:MAG: class I SAM-dependent methyltransferase [Chloroflexaceae bacterium]|nr:class I SAM-dependent methyltransferase [Chloroflexaceae bacterium]
MKEQDHTFSLGARFRACLPAKDWQEVRARHEANRAGWNIGAAWYTRRLDETMARLRNGGSTLHPIERENLGDLRAWCGTAVHLQCASGEDTLSLWNEGVGQVIGIDISDVHIANARRMSAALGAPRCGIGAMSWIFRRSCIPVPTWSTPGGGRCAGCTTLSGGRRWCFAC